MRDGHTRRFQEAESPDESLAAYLDKWQPALFIVAGGPEGTEFVIERSTTTLGRGPGVDLEFDDSTMSKEHAAVEFANGGFRIRDLGSMNGLRLNGSETKVAELKNGDRLQMGQHVFQFVVEKRERKPKTYVVDDA